MATSWFKDAFGFAESGSYSSNRAKFSLSDELFLHCHANGKKLYVGEFSTPSVSELKRELAALPPVPGDPTSGPSGIRFRHLPDPVGVQSLIADPRNAAAFFQAASQFNCLEMVGPGVTPSRGVSGYVNDPTQGPKCALACPAATVFRNYLCHASGEGQGVRQIDCLADVGRVLGNKDNAHKEKTRKKKDGQQALKDDKTPENYAQHETTTAAAAASACATTTASSKGAASCDNDDDDDGGGGGGAGTLLPTATSTPQTTPSAPLWSMQNGYCLPATASSMAELGARLAAYPELVGQCEGCLRVGVHWSTQVGSSGGGGHRVGQVFASALPVAYARGTKSTDWAPFARLVLRAAYDATLAAAALAARKKSVGSNSAPTRVSVFLTCLGGGAFGNRMEWIAEAIDAALLRHAKEPLDVVLVHYGSVVKTEFKEVGRAFSVGAS